MRPYFSKQTKHFLEIDIFTNVHLHLNWGKLRSAHPVTLLDHPVKCRVHSHSWVWAVTCNAHMFTLNHMSLLLPGAKTSPAVVFGKRQQFEAEENVSEASVSTNG